MKVEDYLLKVISRVHSQQLKRVCENYGTHTFNYHRINLKNTQYYVLKKVYKKVKQINQKIRIMEITKEQLREAGMEYAEKSMGPISFKRSKETAKEICGDFIEGAKWLHVQTEKELMDAEADKNLVLKYWDDEKKKVEENKKRAHEAKTLLLDKFGIFGGGELINQVFDLLNKITDEEVCHETNKGGKHES